MNPALFHQPDPISVPRPLGSGPYEVKCCDCHLSAEGASTDEAVIALRKQHRKEGK